MGNGKTTRRTQVNLNVDNNDTLCVDYVIKDRAACLSEASMRTEKDVD